MLYSEMCKEKREKSVQTDSKVGGSEKTQTPMKIILTPFALLFCLLTGRFNALLADAADNSQNQLTEYELKLETRDKTTNCNYLKVSVDGLESHMLYSNSTSVATKVTDGSNQVWEKQGDDKCIGALLTYKGDQKLLLMLVIMKKLAIGSEPLETVFYKFENNQWTKTDKNNFYQTLKDNRTDVSNASAVDIDVSEANKGSELLSADECPIGFSLTLFIPNEKQKIANLSDGTNKIVEGQNDQYPLYFLLAKKVKNNNVKQFGLAVIRTNNGYEDKFYKYDSNKWELTDYSGLKNYIIKAVGFGMLRGSGGGSKKNGK
ncbi:hypothetical protein TOT_040000025 [Theileria orientalis strain Shintoku]|uniref:Signal peptide containing protein n=1 Tax=Theileria orientalis strain Shintoku TaxID=869250 RepID=J4DQ11_THEOR|nr:hypothetical protein TOT_040000025 [Theileria orientalis strain Shintoku]BAM41644.1 hypothetical protein TOT_040000025 [Theileria orientalis strain Shintoku]|eukprot:XP_009691945.1 hypothetical protein TOT_040000025 [Theileria orientalis strain Shintoku]